MDKYWLTSEIQVVGEEGLRILSVTEPEDPLYMTRFYKVQWDWKGKGIAGYSSPKLVDPNAKAKEQMRALLDKISSSTWFLPLALLLSLIYGMGHALVLDTERPWFAGYLVGSKGSVKTLLSWDW